MKKQTIIPICCTAFLLLATPAPRVFAQELIQEIPFDSIPGKTQLAGEVISLMGDVGIGTTSPTATLTVAGTIQSQTGGYVFPDSSVQTTAAASVIDVGSRSVDGGLYNNRIPDFTHNAAYVEFCVKNGAGVTDFNGPGTSTAGGNCVPGDRGWLIEVFERPALSWSEAKLKCLTLGMRLPELFEFQVSCFRSASWGLANMADNYEWASNAGTIWLGSGNGFLGIVAGNTSCNIGSITFVVRQDGQVGTANYRCAL